MPRVPQYEEGQVQHRNLPSVGLSTATPRDAFGASIGEGVQQIARPLLVMAEQEREKADTAQLLEADRALSTWEVERLHAPETGALNQRGKNALGLPDQLLPEYDTRVSEISAKLNTRVQQRFAALAAGRRNDVQRSLYRHVADQSDVILATEAAAYEATSMAAIAANANDPERVKLEVERLWLSQYATLERMGASAEVIKAKRAETETKVHSTLLDQYLASGEYTRAIAYYDEHQAALGEQADEYGKQVHQAKLIIQETALSDQIIASHGTGSAAIAQARNIEDPFLRERVEARIDREGNRRERIAAEGERAVRENAWAKLEQAPPTADLYTILSPRELSALSGMPGVLAQMENRQNSRLQGLEVKTDPREFDRLQRLRDTDPQAFVNTDLSKIYDKLAPADRDYFQRSQAVMNDPGKQAEASTESQQLSTYVWGPLGMSASGNRDAERRGAFWQAYEAEKRAFIDTNGGKAPNDVQRKEIMQRLMLPFVRRGIIWDDEARAFQVPRGEESGFEVDVPAEDRRLIIEAFEREAGRKPNEVEIGVIYQRKQGQ